MISGHASIFFMRCFAIFLREPHRSFGRILNRNTKHENTRILMELPKLFHFARLLSTAHAPARPKIENNGSPTKLRERNFFTRGWQEFCPLKRCHREILSDLTDKRGWNLLRIQEQPLPQDPDDQPECPGQRSGDDPMLALGPHRCTDLSRCGCCSAH